MSTEPTFPRVPVIGLQKRQVSIAHTCASVVILCDCGSPAPILIPNFDRAGLCLACKTKYVIANLQFKNENGLVSLNVDVAKWRGPMDASKELVVPATTPTGATQ